MMEEIVKSGHIVDIIIALMLLEAAGLYALFRTRGHGIPAAGLLGNLLAGMCLLMALRTALTAGDWWLIAFWLAASLVGHLLDLRSRWSSG
jgi:hypothetical protein